MSTRSLKRLDHPAVWWLCFAVGFAIVAARLPTDGSWDFENYHIYNGFAVFHDRRGLDIAPAQSQTTLYYGIDAAYYLIFAALNNRPVLINLLLSLPYSAAALVIFLIGRLFAKPGFLWPALVSVAAAVFGLTGAATFATLATTQSELVPGLGFLIALAMWLILEKKERNTAWTALGVGSLAGVSVGLKLTEAPLFVGLFLAIGARFAIGKRSALFEAITFGVGGVAVFAALDGAWLWSNFRDYGNPIFPFMNNIFRSDLIAFNDWSDHRFLPKTTAMALFYPAYWAFHPSTDVGELSMRDPRILLGCVSALIIILGFVRRWLRERMAPSVASLESLGVSLAIVFLVSYTLWERVWSIYRYLAVQEALSGVLLVAALRTASGARSKPWLMSGLFALVVVSTVKATEYTRSNLARRAPEAISVKLPPFERNAMVLFLDPQPYAYLVPWMPNSARAIGVNNNLVGPRSSGSLWSHIVAAVRDHQGPLWGIEDPNDSPGVADASLASLGLAREGECDPLITNLEEWQHVRICRLRRD